MTTAKEIKQGQYIKVNNDILKVMRKEVVACGTHSHSKTKLFLQGLFSKGQKAMNLSHEENVEKVDIIKKEGQVISKTSEGVQLMDNVRYETFDAYVEKELLGSLNEGDTVTFINVEGKTLVLDTRQ